MADPAAPPPVSAQVVGNVFVQQYYHILHQSPGLVHRFYQDISKLGRPEEDGSMSTTTTMDAINAKILSLNYGDYKAEIKYVDVQESLNGGVSVLVTGYLTGLDDIQQQFTQSFFLAPQDKGYFVLNDIFRYMNNANHHEEEENAPAEDVVAPATPEKVPEVIQEPENNIIEQAAVLPDEPEAEQVVPVENGEVPTVEEDPVPEVVDEVQDSSQLVIEAHTKIEEVPKKSYASIVMDMKQKGVPFSSPASAPRKPQPRKQEQPLINAPPTIVPAAEPVVASNEDAVENGLHEEEVEGYSVYIKGLPMSATPAILDEEFKKFGPIKPNGIQVRNNRGFSFGFVEFETPDAVQKAIEASPVTINGKKAVVEEKRSTNSKGGNRGRYVGGRGLGFRNEVIRGRGGFGGGRGYNRGSDFGGSRNDYGYRGGSRGGSFSNRGGDGYQRANNGGRVNRGADANGTGKITTE
ncbi:nuclear transport factor 2-like [Bidens hawaiensis]|uniref:nuclear transport factor 2-like n=1 Tax=Bidens hawaiensis TaxID=980011 RepID=UPI004049C38C